MADVLPASSSCLFCFGSEIIRGAEYGGSAYPLVTFSNSILKTMGISQSSSNDFIKILQEGFQKAAYCEPCLTLASNVEALMKQIEELEHSLATTTTSIELRVLDAVQSQYNHQEASLIDPVEILRQKLFEEIQFRHSDLEKNEFQGIQQLETTYIKVENGNTGDESMGDKVLPSASATNIGNGKTSRTKAASRSRRKFRIHEFQVFDDDKKPYKITETGSESEDEGQDDEEWTPENDLQDYDSETGEEMVDSKYDCEWRIAKIDENSRQRIVSNPPSVKLRRTPDEVIRRFQSQFQSAVKKTKKSFDRKDRRRLHVKKAHLGPLASGLRRRQHQCPLCEKSYASNSHLRAHHIETHTTERPYSCPHCDKAYKLRNRLNAHLKSHITKCKCDTCPRKFKTEAELESHKAEVHPPGSNPCPERPFSCHRCDKSYTRTSNLRAHQIEAHTTERPYSCPQCDKSFKFQNRLNAHVKTHSTDDRKCDACPRKFKTKAELEIHKAGAHVPGSRPHQCPLCEKSYITVSHLREHHIQAHTTEQPYSCPHCDKAFKSRSRLNTHVTRTHLAAEGSKGKPAAHKCNKCPRKFQTESEVEKHSEVHNEGPRPCPVCQKIMKSHRALRVHMPIHGARTFACKICDKAFAKKANLALHEESHKGLRPYVCHECGLSFTSSQYLKYHHMSVHDPEKTLACTECQRTFASPINLRKHIKLQHRQEYLIRCPQCDKGMYSKSQLSRHLLFHSGERNFECNICHKMFRTSLYLKQHVKRHEQIRDVICNICGKGFFNKSARDRHAAIHKGDMPHVCELCGKKFPVRNYLYIHMKSHNRHGEGTWGWGYQKTESDFQS